MTAIIVVDEPENPLRRAPLVEGKNDFASVTETIARVAEKRTPRGWYLMFGIAVALFLNLGAANHDPKAFADPGTFDIHRPDSAKNISFGKGVHYCLGAKFARFEARVVMEVLTERVPTLDLVAGQQPDPFPNISFRGPSRLAVTW